MTMQRQRFQFISDSKNNTHNINIIAAVIYNNKNWLNLSELKTVAEPDAVLLAEFIYLVSLYACPQVRVTVGDLGLCCCTLRYVFRALINSLVCWCRYFSTIASGKHVPVLSENDLRNPHMSKVTTSGKRSSGATPCCRKQMVRSMP